MNTKELLQKIPDCWEQITLEQFQKIIQIQITDNDDELDGVQNTLSILSVLVNITVDELEQLPMKDIIQMGSKLSFTTSTPEPNTKVNMKFKNIDSLSYNDYIVFIQIQDNYLTNLHQIIKTLSIKKLTDEQVLQMSIVDVMGGFFLLKKQLKRYLNRSIRSTIVLITKQKVKKVFKRITKI